MYSSKKLKIITFHKKIVLQNTPKPSDTWGKTTYNITVSLVGYLTSLIDVTPGLPT